MPSCRVIAIFFLLQINTHHPQRMPFCRTSCGLGAAVPGAIQNPFCIACLLYSMPAKWGTWLLAWTCAKGFEWFSPEGSNRLQNAARHSIHIFFANGKIASRMDNLRMHLRLFNILPYV